MVFDVKNGFSLRGVSSIDDTTKKRGQFLAICFTFFVDEEDSSSEESPHPFLVVSSLFDP